jgi:hypothetical protein
MSYTIKGGALAAPETWTAGTYLLSDDISLGAFDLTLDCANGNIIIKADSHTILVDGIGELFEFNSSNTRRVIFTSVNDDLHGEKIAGSTGLPVSADNLHRFIAISSLVASVTLDWCEFRYCCTLDGTVAFETAGNSTGAWSLRHLFLYNCAQTQVGVPTNTFLIGYAEAFPPHYVASFVLQFIYIDRSCSIRYECIGMPGLLAVFGGTIISDIWIDVPTSLYTSGSLLQVNCDDMDVTLQNIYTRGYSIKGIQIFSNFGTTNAIVKSSIFTRSNPSGTGSGYGISCTVNPAGTAINIEIYNCIFQNYFANVGNYLSIPIGYGLSVVLKEHHNVFFDVGPIHILAQPLVVIPIDATDLDGVDPQFGFLPQNVEIDKTDCIFPDGAAVQNIQDLDGSGYDTYAGQILDPTIQTQTGYQHDLTDQMTAGIYYLIELPSAVPQLSAPIFDCEPNWLYGVKLVYGFETDIFISRFQREQRKPVRQHPLREISFILDQFGTRSEAENFLYAYRNENVIVPIFSEPVLIAMTGSLTGLSDILAQSSLAFLYNLQCMTTYAVLIDLSGTIDPELVVVDFCTSAHVFTLNPIVGAFSGESTVLYPALYGYLNSLRINDTTDDKVNVELTFTER